MHQRMSQKVDLGGGPRSTALGALGLLYWVALLVSISAMELFSTLLLLAVGFSLIKGRVIHGVWQEKHTWPRALTVMGLVFATGMALGLIVNSGAEGMDWKALLELKWILLLFVLFSVFRNSPPSNTHWMIIFSVATGVAFYAIAQFFWGIDLVRGGSEHLHRFGIYWRSIGLFNNPMTYGHSYGIFYFLPLSFALFGKDLSPQFRGLAWLAVLTVGASVVTTQTRGVWIGVTAGTLLVTFLLSRRAFLFSVTGLATLVALFMATVPTIRNRLLTMFDTSFSNNSMRLDLWRANWQIFLDHPFLGVGHGKNVDLLPEYYQKLGIESDFYSHAHNTYLHFLAGMGLWGLLSYLLIFGYIFLRTMRAFGASEGTRRVLLVAAIGAQVAFHVGGLTECNFEDGEVNHMFMAILALVL